MEIPETLLKKRTVFTPFKVREKEDQQDICRKYIRSGKDREGLEVRNINSKIGKGLFATQKFYSGDFLVEYHGDLVSNKEGAKRAKKYPLKYGSYLFFFKHKRNELCIDATFSSRKGRYVNDGIQQERNAEVKRIEVDGIPHLCIFASRNIQVDDEIRFDYGVKNLEWRCKDDSKFSHPLSKMRNRSKEDAGLAGTGNIISQQTIFTKDCYVSLVRLDMHNSHKQQTALTQNSNAQVCVSNQPPKGSGKFEDEELKDGQISCKFQNAKAESEIDESNSSSAMDGNQLREPCKFENSINKMGDKVGRKRKSSFMKNSKNKDHKKLKSTDNCSGHKQNLRKRECGKLQNLHTGKHLQEIKSSPWHAICSTSGAKEYSTPISPVTVSLQGERSEKGESGMCNDTNVQYSSRMIHQQSSKPKSSTKGSNKADCESPKGSNLIFTKDGNKTKEHDNLGIEGLEVTDSLNNGKQVGEKMQSSSCHLSEVISCSSKAVNEQVQASRRDSIQNPGINDFLTQLTSSNIAKQAVQESYIIQEEDVETIPDNLLGDVNVLLDKDIQNSAKPYFTQDAWMCVRSTLCVLKAHQRNDLPEGISVQRNYSSKDSLAKLSKEQTCTQDGEQFTAEHLNISKLQSYKEATTSKCDESPSCSSLTNDVSKPNNSSTPLKSKEHSSSFTISGENQQNSKRNVNRKVKPYRPCPYCGKFQSKLRGHLENKHKHEQGVKDALKLPKQDRDFAFDMLKKKGIMKANLEKMKTSDKCSLIRERSQGSADIVYCSTCLAFISKRFFHRHKKTCYLMNNSTTVPQSISRATSSNPERTTEYERDILNSFHDDTVGKICRSDKLIVRYGEKQFIKVKQNTDKKDEKRKTLKAEMRKLGHLYNTFKETCLEDGRECTSSYDMFDRKNFCELESSVNKLSSKVDGSSKVGYKLQLGYIIKKVGKFIQGDHLIKGEDEKAAEVNRFLSVVHYHWPNIWGDAEYAVQKKRQTSLRKPQSLPLNEDIRKLRNFTITEIKRITDDKYSFMTKGDFVLLRDLLVCRLTLFNARRGGEPSRLLLQEWKDAEKGVWYDRETLNTNNPTDKLLLGQYKLAYQPGKSGKLVPLLIIGDCWNGMKRITDPEVRSQAGVPKNNKFVFPYTQMSDKHVNGWASIKRCCTLAKCKTTVTATGRRHQVATLYAAQDVSNDDRKAFYMHMDHGEGIDANVYQSPPSRKITTHIGSFLLHIDSAGMYIYYNPL